MYEPLTWAEPLVEAVKAHHGVDELAWERTDPPKVREVAVATSKDGRARR